MLSTALKSPLQARVEILSKASPVPNVSISSLISRYRALRLECRDANDSEADAVSGKWIDVYYQLIAHPCASSTEIKAKAELLAECLEHNEMSMDESDALKVFRTFAAI